MKKWYAVASAAALVLILSFTHAVFAVSNEPIHWGFQKGKNGEQGQAGAKLDTLLAKYGSFYKDSKDKKVLYMTFDNGYENGYTAQVLDVLKKEKVPATFFVTGHYLKSAPDLVKRMVNEGHIVGNHSWGHPDMTQISDEQIKEQLQKVKDETARITKQKDMAYLRPPRGIFSERTLKIAQDEGYTHVFWSLAFVDWKTDQQKGWKYSYDNIMAQAHPGAVILLHTVSKDNADALDKAIKDLKKQGYEFKSLDDYMMNKHMKNPIVTP
ncbi:delta-lactam-biosynthetic de-N-acetylase [Falsibacillus pallidus]|uniref:Peptidoglycan-N-acetylmuramic acid deacetylase n=1 Tax=Falsibacillus pallidus TaxID=493781 RepID=A0A370GGE9_9BACI|nr:delta-lactam-biosynthetic de-N-acetylase [Falsibacillus pallidus]RDI42209.1 peptidoglycan-N-acetylmuramic acid deacetylase [Falsibacillus pallidus]